MPAPLRNLIIVSDLHVGCKLALMHPDGAELDEGSLVMPSRLQRWLWQQWREFWDEWVPRVTHKQPFGLVVNGDAIDGVHHNATTQWSHNLADQRRHAEKILLPIVKRAKVYWHVRGTEAHVGSSGTEEEQLAKALGAKPHDGQYARWELRVNVGDGRIHCSHHIGTTNSAAHETSALNAELSAMFNDCGRSGRQPSHILVRSHRHRQASVSFGARMDNGEQYYATCFTTAAWQLKTPYLYRSMQGRCSQPQIGGSLIRQGDEELHTRHWWRDLDPADPE